MITALAPKAALVASAIPVTPPIEWYTDPGLTEPTPITVTDDGRVFGHVAIWGQQHIGYRAKTAPPRSRTNYAHFQFKPTRVLDGDQIVTIETGALTMGTGHAGMSLNSQAATAHYDNSGAIAATVRVGEDAVGIWFAGAMMPDIDELSIRRFLACGISGDWRPDGRGGVEMCAALAVPVPGFPVARARVASGAPLALVAAGALAPQVQAFAKLLDPAWSGTSRIGDATVGKLTAGNDVSARIVGLQRAVTPADLAEQIAASLHRRQQDDALATAHAELIGELDDTPDRYAALMAEVDDTPDRAEALLAELSAGDVDPKEVS